MKYKTRLIFVGALFFTAITFYSCEKLNKCQGYDCFTPPPVFIFDIVDAENGQNVFASGMIAPGDVDVNNENDQWVKHTFDNSFDSNFLILPEIGWKMGEAGYKISLNDSTQIELFLNMKELNENCCTFFRILEFEVINHPFSIVDSTDIIRVEI